MSSLISLSSSLCPMTHWQTPVISVLALQTVESELTRQFSPSRKAELHTLYNRHLSNDTRKNKTKNRSFNSLWTFWYLSFRVFSYCQSFLAGFAAKYVLCGSLCWKDRFQAHRSIRLPYAAMWSWACAWLFFWIKIRVLTTWKDWVCGLWSAASSSGIKDLYKISMFKKKKKKEAIPSSSFVCVHVVPR